MDKANITNNTTTCNDQSDTVMFIMTATYFSQYSTIIKLVILLFKKMVKM